MSARNNAKDGFVSMECTDKGTLTTPPLVFEGKELRVNYTAQHGGSIRVALLDEQGKAIKGFDAKDCQPLTGDSVSGTVAWKKSSDISSLLGKSLRAYVSTWRKDNSGAFDSRK